MAIYFLKPENESASIIPSLRIFLSLTTLLLKEYLTSSRSLLLLNFNANKVNAYANLSTCTICDVPLSFCHAASCVTLRDVAVKTTQHALRPHAAQHPVWPNLYTGFTKHEDTIFIITSANVYQVNQKKSPYDFCWYYSNAWEFLYEILHDC